jgi:CAAX prenyl protease-like protein
MTSSESKPTDAPTTTERPHVDHGPPEPWRSCVYPMLAFLLVGLFEPAQDGGGLAGRIGIPYGWYPPLYAVRVALTLWMLYLSWPSLRGWLGRPTWWPPVLGFALVVPWIWLSKLQKEGAWITGDTGRVGFDPFEHYGEDTNAAWAYIALRFLGLAVVVPIVEELFLRGFLLRFVIRERFWTVPFGALDSAVALTCGLYAVGSHPAEAVAAIVWFAAMTWIAWKTRKPIDCITAHAATNFALGLYVVATRSWWLL